jgi:hypothetical protein
MQFPGFKLTDAYRFAAAQGLEEEARAILPLNTALQNDLLWQLVHLASKFSSFTEQGGQKTGPQSTKPRGQNDRGIEKDERHSFTKHGIESRTQ